MILEDITKHDIEQIKRECSDFIKHNDQPLWRGMRFKGDIVKVPIRTDRLPRDSSNLETVLYNMLVEERYNIRNIRNRVAYVSTGENQASGYGKLYMVLPINGTDMFYDPSMRDSAEVMNRVVETFYSLLDLSEYTNNSSQIIMSLRNINAGFNTTEFENYLIDKIKHFIPSMDDVEDYVFNLLDSFKQEEGSWVSDIQIHKTNEEIRITDVHEYEIGLFNKKYYYAITDVWNDWFDDKSISPLKWYKQVLGK